MRIITINLNGIRSAAKKGFFQWLALQHADIVCLQEIKAQHHHLNTALFNPAGFHCYYFPAEKSGYSGVGLYSRIKPDQVTCGLGWPTADNEGRYIQADFGQLSVASLYLPSGSSGEERQKVKFDFLDHYLIRLTQQIESGRDFIITGDFNIVHKEIDIKNWRSNQKNSGCLPEERAWLDTLFYSLGFIDAFRVVNQQADQYTWWSNRGQARANNVGWRIDYQIVTPGLKDKIQSAQVYKENFFSDHAPLIMDYAFEFNGYIMNNFHQEQERHDAR